MLPGAHEARGTIVSPCGTGHESAPRSHSSTVRFEAQPGRSHVIGWLQPIAPRAPALSHQMIVMIVGDAASKALGHVRHAGPIVPCAG
jgi:hypothetical protein